MKELEDYDWFPQVLRRQQMDYIGWLVSTFSIYKPIIPFFDQQLPIYDLCSGTGQPAIYIHKHIKSPKCTLTDKYPQNSIPSSDRVEYLGKSTDVLKYNFGDNAHYTMFNAFHHFTNEEQDSIIKKLSNEKKTFTICEIVTPSVLSFFLIFVATTFGQLLFAPFVKKFSWKRLILTYLLPINLITISFDGLVSVLKSRSWKEYSRRYLNIAKDYEVSVTSHKTMYVSNIVVIKGRRST